MLHRLCENSTSEKSVRKLREQNVLKSSCHDIFYCFFQCDFLDFENFNKSRKITARSTIQFVMGLLEDTFY